MHEIHPGGRLLRRQQWTTLAPGEWSPAHVGNPFTLLIRQAFNPALQQSEPFALPFGTGVEQQLKTQADPEDRTLLLAPLLQMRNQAGGRQVLHGGVKSTNTRKDQGIAAVKLIGC